LGGVDNNMGTEDVIRHMADQKNNSKPYHNFRSISACILLRFFCHLR